jgi:hypothetical protein
VTAGGTQLLTDLNSIYGGVVYEFINGILYFSTYKGGDLWRSDGTECDTFKVGITGGAYPIAKLNTTLIFGSYQQATGWEPYAYDPTGETAPCEQPVADAAVEESVIAKEQKVLTAYPNPFSGSLSFASKGPMMMLLR